MNNQQWVNKKEIKSQILEVKNLTDKNLRDYLVLRLTGLDGIFVFASNISENRWIELVEGKEYAFTIAENDKGYLNLLDFLP